MTQQDKKYSTEDQIDESPAGVEGDERHGRQSYRRTDGTERAEEVTR